MSQKVILAGGTGFIGGYLEEQFTRLGYTVVIISRQPGHIPWTDQSRIISSLEHADLLVNLAGKSVNCRYNSTNKAEILRSRTETTRILGEALQACGNPPPLWINSSTATIYRHAEDRPMTERDGEIGSGFSVDVAREWEQAFFSFKLPRTRQAALRIAIVLGKGGVISPYKNLVRFGLGGPQGSGRQQFSWIHVDDIFGIIRFLQNRTDLEGIFNASSPQPVTNRELMRLMRETMHQTIGLPAPRWMLELGAILIRTETELILKSRWVLPERLLNEGYQFRFDRLDRALQDILR